MATITAGNELYLYQLLSREAGVGRQIMLTQVEEILLADDIWPSDLGCSDVREVLEHLSSFVRLTVFKKGRVYATIAPNPEWDAILERAQADKADKPADKSGAKSWKRKRAKRDPKPTKPRPKGRPNPAAEVVETEVAEAEMEAKTAEVEAKVEAEAAEPKVETVANEAEAEIEVEAEAEPAEIEAATEAAEVEVDTTAIEAAAEPTEAKAPTPTETPSITFTITYDPYQEEAKEGTGTEGEPASPASEAPAPTATGTSASPTSQTRYPQSFATDVLIRNNELSALYQILPLDVDPVALLDEDWRVARSTGDFRKNGSTVTFPLRYQGNSSGQSVRVTLRRIAATGSGKRWSVDSIAGVEEVDLAGLPTSGNDASRSLAQFAQIGPWNELAEALAQKAGINTSQADAASKSTGGARTTDTSGRLTWSPSSQELQEYLTHTFRRIQCEDKFVTYEGGMRGAFDTGLLTPDAQGILMCFDAMQGDIPWRFAGFLTPAEEQLNGPAPLPATYLTALEDIVLTAESSVRVGKELARSYGPELQDAVDVAVRRAQRDYRLATPAYDPVDNEVHLLVPLTLADGEQRALVLCPATLGQGFVARAILSCERAAECARVVSFELPRWLG